MSWCRKWHTGQLEVLVPLGACGFESRLGHKGGTRPLGGPARSGDRVVQECLAPAERILP